MEWKQNPLPLLNGTIPRNKKKRKKKKKKSVGKS